MLKFWKLNNETKTVFLADKNVFNRMSKCYICRTHVNLYELADLVSHLMYCETSQLIIKVFKLQFERLYFNTTAIQMVLSLSHVMRKPVNAICEQQTRRSACASAQSDQRLCCSLPG